MKTILNIYKPVGKTPLEMVKKIKTYYPELEGKKVGYAGRLDPMANGVLLLLVGDMNKQKVPFESLTKEYVFEAVFGMKTDSYDLLGKVTEDNKEYNIKDLKKQIKKESEKYEGTFLQTFPPYSAIRLNGKPLYYWELRGALPKKDIPQKNITIYSFQLISFNEITSEKMNERIKSMVHRVSGNFRQEEILKTWDVFLKKDNKTFITASFSIRCSSGTYVRSIVNDLGEKLKVNATTLSILRTAVGEYTLKKSLII
jgi:tRNA pseudouridine55 synthase